MAGNFDEQNGFENPCIRCDVSHRVLLSACVYHSCPWNGIITVVLCEIASKAEPVSVLDRKISIDWPTDSAHMLG